MVTRQAFHIAPALGLSAAWKGEKAALNQSEGRKEAPGRAKAVLAARGMEGPFLHESLYIGPLVCKLKKNKTEQRVLALLNGSQYIKFK